MKIAKDFLEGKYQMEFVTPLGKIMSEQYTLQEHYENYVHFFIVRPNREDNTSYSFFDTEGDLNVLTNKTLEKTNFCFQGLKEVFSYYHAIKNEPLENLTKYQLKFLLLAEETYLKAHEQVNFDGSQDSFIESRKENIKKINSFL